MLPSVRAYLWISALFAVLASVSIAVACGRVIGSGDTGIPLGLWASSPISWSIGCAWVTLLKPGIAVALAARPVSGKVVIGALLSLLILVLFNVVTVVAVLTSYHSIRGSNILPLALAALMIELMSGYLPAFAYVTRRPQRSETSGAEAQLGTRPPAVTTQPPTTPSAPQAPRDFSELIHCVKERGTGLYPHIKLEPDGSLFAGQRAFAQALGISTGGCNARLKAEERAGTITVAPTSLGTRIALRKENRGY